MKQYINTFDNILFFLKKIWIADKGIFLWIAFAVLLQIPSAYLDVMLFKLLIDAITGVYAFSYILLLIILKFITEIFAGILTDYINGKRMAQCTLKFEYNIGREIILITKKIDTSDFDSPDFQNTISLSNTVIQNHNIMLMSLRSALTAAVSMFTSITVLINLSPIFFILSLISAFLIFAIRNQFQRSQYEYSVSVNEIWRRSAYFKSLFFGRASSLDIKQYSSIFELLLNKYLLTLGKSRVLSEANNKRRFNSEALQRLVNVIVNSIIPFTYLGYAAYRREISISDMTALISAFGLLTSGMSSITLTLSQLLGYGRQIEHLRKYLNYEPIIENNTDGEELDSIQTIEFRGVTFQYPGSETLALNDVKFTVSAGKKTAIVGINGAGKTTIVKLILRYYDPDFGAVLINGRDLREYNVRSVRNAVTAVFQEFQSYSLPIDEFISCAEGENIDVEAVAAALKRVGLYDTVMEKGGLNAELSKYFDENGIIFSGGQLQKLIIARMLYKNSGFLIMDEPSAALDPESEYNINRDIFNAANDRTLLMISHRLSTVRDADCIILIEDGTVKEQGAHNELLERGGRYAELFNMQASGYN
jgi:ABC-type multidrug transport system fused ATPase/permease subunit